MPLPDKKTVLDWYKNFCLQLKETYGLDLTRKTDLMRVGCLHPENLHKGEMLDHPFIRHTENGYADPEPKMDYQETASALTLFAGLSGNNAPKGMTREEAARKYQAHVEKMDEAHHAWEIRNQTLFDASKEDDFDQIARLYRDAHEGRLFLYDGNGDVRQARNLYVGENGRLCATDVVSEKQLKFTVAPGTPEISVTRAFEKVCTGIIPITENMNPVDRHNAETDNLIVTALLEKYPEMSAMTGRTVKACDKYLNGELQAEEPEPVERPGFLSRLKWLVSFGRNTADYDKYNDYRARKARWDTEMAEAENGMVLYRRVEKGMMADAGLLPEIGDDELRRTVVCNHEQVAGVMNVVRDREANQFIEAAEDGAYGELPEDPELDTSSVLREAREAFLKEAVGHPEHFDRNGNRTAAGRVALANRTMDAEQKLEAVKGLDTQIAAARESAMDRIRARLAETNTSGEIASDKTFAADVATLIQTRSLEGRLAGYKKGDDLFRGFDMKKQGIEESGIYLASHPSFKKAFGTKDDLREIAFDLAQCGRSPEALNDRLDSLLKRYNDARKPADGVKQSEGKADVKEQPVQEQPVQEKKNGEPEDKWIMREPKSLF